MKAFIYLSVLAALVAASPAAAQNLPGYQGDYDAAHAEYRAYAIGEFQKVFAQWMEAVKAGNAEEAARYYTDNAYLYLGQSDDGRGEVEESLDQWLDGIDDLRTGLTDFDASGSISYATLDLVINGADPADDGSATMMLVLKKVRGGWKIRSQTLFRHES